MNGSRLGAPPCRRGRRPSSCFRDVPPADGKLVLELELPRLMTPDGSRLLAQDIRMRRLRGPGRSGLTGRNGRASPRCWPASGRRWSSARHPGGIPAQDSSELLPAEKDPGGVLAPSGRKRKPPPLLGCLEIHPGGDGASGAALVWRAAQRLLLLWLTYSGANVLLLDEPTRNLSPLTGPVVREMLAAFRGRSCPSPRPAVPGAGVYRRLSAGTPGPAAAAAGTAAELNARRRAALKSVLFCEGFVLSWT